jgi:hypothetical protein
MSNIRTALQQVVQGDSDIGLLPCDAVLLEVQFPTFWEIARVKQIRNPED